MEANRVTQADVARRAGVHRTSVSLAFKNHPSIPAETRARILKIADELGYVPDPMLAALVSYRNRTRPRSFHGALAWLINSSNGYDWQYFQHYRDYHRGAERRAKQHGYVLETFDLNAPGLSLARSAGILRARNIAGVLLCPQPKAQMEMNFPWEQFSAVTFGYTLAEPHLHTVTATHYRSAVRTMRELRRRGYRRIGFAFAENHDQRTDRNYYAAYLVEQDAGVTPVEIPPLFASVIREGPEPLRRWIEQYRPDAVMTGEHRIVDILEKIGFRVPGDIGVACACLPSPNTHLAGVIDDSEHIGEVAVDFLVAAVQRGEKGAPEQPQRIHVEGLWHEGDTLRPLPADRA